MTSFWNTSAKWGSKMFRATHVDIVNFEPIGVEMPYAHTYYKPLIHGTSLFCFQTATQSNPWVQVWLKPKNFDTYLNCGKFALLCRECGAQWWDHTNKHNIHTKCHTFTLFYTKVHQSKVCLLMCFWAIRVSWIHVWYSFCSLDWCTSWLL